MAFGISKMELRKWKQRVEKGEVAFLTHYWFDPRFPNCRTITKVGCSDRIKLIEWCRKYNLDPKYIHDRKRYPHFDLLGPRQKEILLNEGEWEQVRRFKL